MNSYTTDTTEKYAWVDALLEHRVLQERKDYEEQFNELEWTEDEEEEGEDEGEEDDAFYFIRHADLTAVGLGLVRDEHNSGSMNLISDLAYEFSEAQDDALYERKCCVQTEAIQNKHQKLYQNEVNDWWAIPMEICNDTEYEDEDEGILDENGPLFPRCLFPEGRNFEVDADGDIIIDRLPSGNTLVLNNDLFLQEPPPCRSYDEDAYDSMPELVSDNSSDDDEESSRIIT